MVEDLIWILIFQLLGKSSSHWSRGALLPLDSQQSLVNHLKCSEGELAQSQGMPVPTRMRVQGSLSKWGLVGAGVGLGVSCSGWKLIGNFPSTSSVFFRVEMFSLQISTLFRVTWGKRTKNELPAHPCLYPLQCQTGWQLYSWDSDKGWGRPIALSLGRVLRC